MKYAKEVIDLLAAYPGRRFKMSQIINYVDPRADLPRRRTIRMGVVRVLASLEDSGHVEKGPDETGGHPYYWWKFIHVPPTNLRQPGTQYARDLTS